MKKARLNLELPEKTKKRIEQLKDDSEAASISEVLRRAVQLYELVIQNEKENGTLFMRDSKGKETTITILH